MSEPGPTKKKVSQAHRESVMQAAALRSKLITAAVDWYMAGCPDLDADGDGPMGAMQDAIDAYIDHERQVKERAEERKRQAKKKDPAEMARQVLEWMQTPEGQESMRKAAAASDEFAAQLREARNIPWEKLHEPFTI